jgi:hypothetical protein
MDRHGDVSQLGVSGEPTVILAGSHRDQGGMQLRCSPLAAGALAVPTAASPARGFSTAYATTQPSRKEKPEISTTYRVTRTSRT